MSESRRLRQALTAIRALRERNAELEAESREPIAIVALGCRFPGGVYSPEDFWQLLHDGTDPVRPVPIDRWDNDAWFDSDREKPDRLYVKEAAFLDQIDRFDAELFGIAPREAQRMDPQQRILLETAWETFERAGWVPREADDRTGVFIGSMWNEYANRGLQMLENLDPWVATGAAGCFLGGRVAYHLGLRGPTVPVDTACSSSLVAVHLACESLRRGECRRAIAGGVNVMLGPELTVLMCRLQALSPSGRCRTFDAAADGYGRGEGCGLVALKRLSDARRDGDPVLAVVRGSACNHNGTGSGLTVPSADAQRDVIQLALRQAAVRPDEIGFVEAHGTGTALGDPIELRALWSVLGEQRDSELLVASVKSNIGHLEGAAGIAGLIRTVLCLQHHEVTPHLHLTELNPRIASESFAVRIPTEVVDWPTRQASRLAGVSSFGLSGVNCHVIVGEADAGLASTADLVPSFEDLSIQNEWRSGPLLLSAASLNALRELAVQYRTVLQAEPQTNVAEFCAATASRRGRLEFRCAVDGDSAEALSRQLQLVISGQPPETTSSVGRRFLGGGPFETGRQSVPHVPLPTYPFQRQRYWYEPAATSPGEGHADRRRSSDLLYRVGWIPGGRHKKPESAAADADFAAEFEIIDLRPAGNFDQAMEALLKLSRRARSLLNATDTNASQRLVVVTAAAVAVEEDSAVEPWQSLLLGAVQAASLEHPQLFAGLVDLTPEHSQTVGAALRSLVSRSLTEAERQIAVRDDRVFVRRVILDSKTQRATGEPESEHRPASWEGTCLVTGGLGAIGRALAGRVAASGASHVILVSRRAPDADTQRAIEEMERTGCSVGVRSVDVSAEASVRRLLDEIRDRFPPLRGVIHAAGTAELSSFAELSDEHVRRVWAAKVLGAFYLLKHVERETLQRVVFVSSVAGVWGGDRQAAYAGANAWLDGLAAQLRNEGVNAVSLDFGPWDSGGLSDQRMIEWLSASGLRALSNERALQAFDEVLTDRAAASIVVADVDWPRFLDVFEARRRSSLFDDVRAEQSLEDSIDDMTSRLAGDWSTEELTELVRQATADVLAKPVELVDVERGFFLQGMDSLMAVELRRRLERQLRLRLPATLAMDAPRVTDVVRLLLGSHVDSNRRVLAGDATRRNVENEPVAIVGLGCRFPGASSPDEFWTLLEEGREAIREVPRERWNIDDWFDPDANSPGCVYTRVGGFIDGIDQFDPHFFDITPREAVTLDPQQRLLLEVSWEALEHAGMVPETLRGSRTGVYVGVGANEYEALWPDDDGTSINGWFATGNALNAIAGRVAFTFGLTGPAVAIDTACSSSLVALHQAVQGLRSGDCDAALAAGVNALLRPDSMVAACQAGMLSPSGHCHTFSASADGYVRAEGCGVVVLKRLSDARRDGDQVLAVVRGSAVNQDGASGGLTVPHGPSQQQVIEAALRNAAVDARQVAYVEAHGTGTKLGDPIEVQAAAAALASNRQPERPLLIGSVKTNIGHLESAAGIAGIIKVTLAMQHGRIPRQLHGGTLNPHVEWDRLPVNVVNEPLAWPSDDRQFAGVSGFGFTGTNSHVVLQRTATEARCSEAAAEPQRLIISGRTAAALREQVRRYRDWLHNHPDASLVDVCETARQHRQRFAHVAAFDVTSVAEAVEKLTDFALDSGSPSALAEDRRDDQPGSEAREFRLVPLPTYAFQHRRYWICEPRRRTTQRAARTLSGRRQELADGRVVYAAQVSLEDQPWLNDHRVYGAVVVPGATWVALVLKAVGLPGELLDVEFEEAVRLEDDARWLELVLLPSDEVGGSGRRRFEILTRPDGASDVETRHAFGFVHAEKASEAASAAAPSARAWIEDDQRLALVTAARDGQLPGRDASAVELLRELDPVEMFAEFATLGLDCGTIYRQALRRLWLGEKEAVGEIAISESLASDPCNEPIHPLLFDVCNCVTGAFLAAQQTADAELYVPLGYRRIRWFQSVLHPEGQPFLCHVRFVRRTAETETFDLQIVRAGVPLNGRVAETELLAIVEGLTVKRAPRDAFLRVADNPSTGTEAGRSKAASADSRLLPLLQKTPAENRSRVVLDFVREEFRDALGKDALPDPHAGMIDLGLDSLIGVELRQRLNVGIGEALPLPATVFFEQPTISGIANHLCELLGEHYEWFSPRNAELDSEHQSLSDAPIAASLLSEVLKMSDEEAAEALLAELEGESE